MQNETRLIDADFLRPQIYPCFADIDDTPVKLNSQSCPICRYGFTSCQCRYTGPAHPDRSLRKQVVLDNLHLLSKKQVKHIIKLESDLQVSYGDSEREAILKELTDAHSASQLQRFKIKLEDIIIPQHYCLPSEQKLEACRTYYNRHHKIDRNLIVNPQGVLLDGYVGYFVLMENGVVECDVVVSDSLCVTYICGNHPGRDELYYWHVSSETKNANRLVPGKYALVRTRYGPQPIVIQRIFKSTKPPYAGRILPVLRALDKLPEKE